MPQFASQSTYGRHGMRICTPVCMLVCANFMRIAQQAHDDITSFFDARVVDSYMRASHALYDQSFPDATAPVLLKTLLPFLSGGKDSYDYQEVAGVNYGPCEAVEVDDMRIIGLGALLRSRLVAGEASSALLVTVGGHTTALLFDAPRASVYHFDPLPATLKDVTQQAASTLQRVGGDLTKPPAPYDGLLLY